MKKISVILTSKNESSSIKGVIKFFLKQDYPKKEIIVVDDSTDNTKKIVRQFKEVKLIEGNNKGISNARNLGLKKASGKIIMFSDTDINDTSEKTLLSRLCEPFNKEGADLVYIDYKVKQTGNLLRDVITLKDFGSNKAALSHMPEAYSAELLRKLKGFNEELEYGEDADLAMRAASNAKNKAVAKGSRLMDSNLKSGDEFVKRYLWYGRTIGKKIKKTNDWKTLIKLLAYWSGIILFPLGLLLIAYNYLFKSTKTFLTSPKASLLMPWINYLTFIIIGIGVLKQ